MTKEITVLEGNKMIAEFMGFEGQHEEWCGNNILDKCEIFGQAELRPYRPDERWDDLMPVVEKMDAIGYALDTNPWSIVVVEYLSGNEAVIINYEIHHGLSKIKNWWQAVVSFIQWYNESKHQEG